MVSKELQKLANGIARRAGYGTATEILFEDIPDTKIFHHDYGYYKNTTGERVSNAYWDNFGWKNTHYEWAKTKIVFPLWPEFLARAIF